ncbi:PREDICTED: two pore calcium channel protein 1-like isoform X2 [Amphimedon queenslandica]|uniref:Ion transport domain-containing protein n=1 Tax=Amphimedon queenslandica TaxID=400682 RepID=A0AAN0J7M9_AMPQE|nr:PREDICTED: two pore calcium channel protein 1-like isoform X2 [Amphimedon queenslandica]|eukprot:XP_019852736.1 PREDICTED: two pore calcium channel protein 1-like isoform X2 [Amphimedon queenslandica]
MATSSSTGSGGIPRLLYDSVHEPLLLPDPSTQYGSPIGGTGSGGSSASEARKRNFTAALNPSRDSESELDTQEREQSPMLERRYLDVPQRFKGRGQLGDPAVDESGTMINVRSIENRSSEVPGFHEFVPYLRDSNRTKYEEAALFAKEGEDNNKFASHPNGKYSKVAYHLVHHPVVYMIDFIASCLLLGLAVIEHPSLIPYPANEEHKIIAVHTCLELILLSIIGFNIVLRVIWMKPRTFLRQRAVIAAIILIVMYIEAMVILFQQSNHFRITRCLRIVFFVDSYILVGVRRVLRQIIQCLKPILDVMILLFFMMAIFALMGYYLFATIDPTFFDSYLKSFVSLFITLTTANHPDVFMEAYVRNKWSPLFFVLYLFVTLYFFSNVLLAVVYAHFNDEEKNKFRKLFLHKREALKIAFSVLAVDGKLNYHDFVFFMLEYKPRIPEYQVMCIFKGLKEKEEVGSNEDGDYLCMNEFLNLYEFRSLKWKQVRNDGRNVEWYDDFPQKIKPFFAKLNKAVHFKYFNSVMALIVLANALYLVLFTLATSFYCGTDGANNPTIISSHVNQDLKKYCKDDRFTAGRNAIYGSFVFVFIYVAEISIRILAVGPLEYFRKWWNRFDFIIILLSVIFLIIEADAGPSHKALRYLIVFRPIKFLRLLRLRRRYYDIMNTVFVLGHRLLSVLLLIFVIFYFYAIIGMEVFAGKVFVGCCDKALFGVGGEYQGNGSITKPSPEVYWLNNFDNIYQSYIILYEEMVVNNWFVQMEGFVAATNIAARVYFFLFWCTTTVCLSVVIAYIVDAFVFRIQASEMKKRCEKHADQFECTCQPSRKKKVEITLAGRDINQIKYQTTLMEENDRRKRGKRLDFINHSIRKIRRIDFDLIPSREVYFTGKRLRTKEDLNLEMYRSELQDWIAGREYQLQNITPEQREKKSFKVTLRSKVKAVVLFLLE